MICPRLVLSSTTAVALGLSGAFSLSALPSARAEKVEYPLPSSHSVLQQRVGITDISVDYSRPNKNGRETFGKLVPYGAVWRTGANSATKITFSTAMHFGTGVIEPGTYGLFTIPTPDAWTIILSKNPDQWGAYTYKQADDVLRVTVKPEAITTPVETFTIYFADVKEATADLILVWDQVRVAIPLSVDTINRVTSAIKHTIGTPDATPQFYAQAAGFYYSHDLDLPTALGWIDLAIKGTPDSSGYMFRKANIQKKLNDKTGARLSAEKAMALVKAKPGPDDAETLDAMGKFLESLK